MAIERASGAWTSLPDPGDGTPFGLKVEADRLAEMARMIGADGFGELIEKFDEWTPAFLAALKNPTEYSALSEAAHSMAGVASYLGLDGLASACRQLEASCRGEAVAAVADILDKIPRLLAASRFWLEQFRPDGAVVVSLAETEAG